MNNSFFETSALLITFVVLGKYLESVAKARTTTALLKLLDLQPRTKEARRGAGVIVWPLSFLSTPSLSPGAVPHLHGITCCRCSCKVE